MDLTAEQQRQLLLKMANDAAKAGVPPEKIDAKLKAFSDRIEQGENIFAPVFERAREINQTKKTFNKASPDWTPSVSREANNVRMSPNVMYREGYNPAADVDSVSLSEAAAKEAEGRTGLNFSNAVLNAGSMAGRTLLAAIAGGGMIANPGIRDEAGEDILFGAIDSLREGELRRTTGKNLPSMAGSLLGGIATAGIGSLSSGQDVIAEGGTLPQALGAQATDLATLEAGLATGLLLPGASFAKRALAQGAASGAAGAGGRAAKNEFVPESLKQDALDPTSIAFDVGGGVFGAAFPNKPKATKEAPTIRTGDEAVDSGIKAASQLMRRVGKKVDVDPNKPFVQTFEKAKSPDFSTTPKEEVDVEAFVNEPKKQVEIERAYEQLKRERRATEELAYAQKAASDAAIYQELPGIEPTETVRGATEQTVPRGKNLTMDQLSVLRDQLRQEESPQIEAPSRKQAFTAEYLSDVRNPTADVTVTDLPDPTFRDGPRDLSGLVDAQKFIDKKVSTTKVYGKPSWEWNPESSEITTRDNRLPKREKVRPALDLASKISEVEQSPLFSRFKYRDEDNTAATRNFDQLSQSRFIASPQQRASLSPVADAVRKAGNAYDVADMIIGTTKRNPERATTAELFQKFKDNPVTSDLMKNLKVSVINPEDLARSNNRIIQLLGPDATDKRNSWGVYHPSTGVAVLGEGFARASTGDHGLNPTTLAHEIVHGLTSEVIHAVDQGRISDPKIKQAIDEVSAWREVFGTEVSRLAQGDKTLTNLLEYGQTNNHEFLAVAASDPRVQAVMKNIKVGDVTMWQKFIGTVRKMLGLRPKDEVMLNRVLDLTEQIATYDVNAKSKDIPTVPGLETVEPRRMVQNSVIPVGPKVKSRIEALGSVLRAGAQGDGVFPKIRQAKEVASGEKAVGVTKAETMGNLYRRETKGTDAASLDKDIDLAIKNSGSQTGVDALARINNSSPAIGSMVREFAQGRRAQAIQYARNILSNPNVTNADKGLAAKVLDQVDSYLVRAYAQNEIKGYGENKLALAQRAEDKIAAGKTPFNREQKALEQTNALKAYLKKTFFPDSLDGLRSDQLEQLYTFYTTKDVTDIAPLESFGSSNPKALRKAFMKAEIQAAMDKTGSVDEGLDQLVKAVAGVEKKAPIVRYFKNLREGSDVKATLDDVPEPIRKFWGEIESPVARMMATVRNQASINSQMNALASLRKEGLGTLLKEGKGHEGYTATLTGEKMGPLQGLSTTPDVLAALESFVQTGQYLGSWKQVMQGDPTGRGALAKLAVQSFQAAKAVTSARKSASVIGNFVGSVLRNGYGSFLQSAANGNINPKYWAQGLNDVRGLIGLSSKTELTPQAQTYLKYKVAEGSQLEDTYSPAARRVFQRLADTEGFMSPDTLAQRAEAAVKELGYKGSAAWKITKELYGAADLWSKLSNFRYEKDFWTEYFSKHGGAVEDLDKFVADRINNTNITPGRASPAAKVSDYVGASTFLPYTAEVGRSLYNNVAYGFKDMLDGAKLGHKDLMLHGLRRVVGASSATTLGTYALTAGLKAGGAAAGLIAEELGDDTDRKKYLESREFTAGSKPIVLKDSEGKDYVFDVGMTNPYDPIARPIATLIEAINETDPKRQEAKIKEAQKATLGLLHQNSVWGYLSKAAKGETPGLAKSNDRAYSAALETLVNDVGLSKQDADRVINLGMIVAPKGLLEAYKGATEETDPKIKALVGSGVGVNRLDVAKDIANYEGAKFTSELTKAKKGYTDLLKVDFDVDPKRVEAQFVDAIKDLAQPYNNLQLAVNAAKEQGKSNKEVLQALKLGRVSNKAIVPILQGKSPPVRLMLSSLDQDIRDDLVKDQSGKSAERARRNRGILRDLILKYNNVTAEELIANGQ